MILLDSNIVIYAAQPEFNQLREWLRDHSFAVSQLSRFEVLGYHRIAADVLTWFTAFFNSVKIFPISNNIIEAAIPLRKTYKMSLGDSVIAATALNHKLELCTNNDKDFKSMENLRIIDIKKYIA
jgi:predicted nucleic acid-binding protein